MPSPPPGQQGGLGGGTPPNVGSGNFNFFSPEGMSDLVLAWNGKSENLDSSITKSDKPQSIETRPSLNIKKQTINQRLESRPKQTDAMIV